MRYEISLSLSLSLLISLTVSFSIGWSQTVPVPAGGSDAVFATDGLFTATNSVVLHPAARTYYQRLKQAGRYGYAELVRTRSVAEVQQRDTDGRFRLPLTLPKLGETIEVQTLEVRAEDAANYLWRGTLPSDPTSQIVLRSRADTLFGTIRFANKTYVLEGLEPGVSLLLGDLASDTDGEKSSGNFVGCPMDGGGSSLTNGPGKETPGEELEKVMTCQSDVFRIQVLYTTAAQQTGNMSQLAQASVDQLNDMLLRSNVSLEAELVAVESFSQFSEGTMILSDVGLLTGDDVVLTNIINNRMGANGADLTIVFTDAVYNGPIGTVSAIGPPSRVAIVTAPNATSEMTFAHEVGHLLGGRHEEPTSWTIHSDPDIFIFTASLAPDPTVSVGHAHIDFNFNNWPFNDRARVTGMFSNAALDGPQMLQAGWNVDYLPLFSNTTTGTYNGYSVGTVGVRDNAAVFNNNATTVVGLNPQCDFYAYANANPDFGAPNDSYSVSASSVGCVSGSAVYQWSTSTNGFTYTFAGSGSSLSGSLPNINGTFRIRLNARCDNGDGNTLNDPTAVAYDNIYVEEGGCEFCRPVPTEKPATSPGELAEPILNIWPNPSVHGTVNMLYDTPDSKNDPVRITIQDQRGKTVRRYTLPIRSTYTIDTSDLPNGIYVARAVRAGHSLTRKIVVTR